MVAAQLSTIFSTLDVSLFNIVLAVKADSEGEVEVEEGDIAD